jgi:hypothetical protein
MAQRPGLLSRHGRAQKGRNEVDQRVSQHDLSHVIFSQRQATVPIMIGHRLMGHALLLTGEIGPALAHYSQSLALYDPAEHQQFATRFGSDISVAALGFRSLALWLLGCPEKALRDASRALKNAQEIGQAATLMFALTYTSQDRNSLRELRGCKFASRAAYCFSGSKGRTVLEVVRYIGAGLCAGRDRRYLRRRPSAYTGNNCTALNWRNAVCSMVSLELGKGLRGPGRTR